MSQIYKDAIEIVAGGFDATALVRQIAKDSPGALVKAARVLGFTSVSLEARVRAMLKDDDGQGTSAFVEAIKLVRAERNLPLKEAKDFVDALR